MQILYQAQDCGISIHALREEGDQLGQYYLVPFKQISIHALREEGDESCFTAQT